MSPRRSTDDSGQQKDSEELETEVAPEEEQEHAPQEDSHPKTETHAKQESRSAGRAKPKDEGESKPAEPPAATGSMAHIMRFDPKRRRR